MISKSDVIKLTASRLAQPATTLVTELAANITNPKGAIADAVAIKKCVQWRASVADPLVDYVATKLPEGATIPSAIDTLISKGPRRALQQQAVSVPCTVGYDVGIYLQLSGDFADPQETSIALFPTKQAGYVKGADDYYLGLLTNSFWATTGALTPATTPPPAYQWSPINGAGTPYTRPLGDSVPKPVIPGAERVMFVLGGDDNNFGNSQGNPGVPQTSPPTWGRVTIDALSTALTAGQWDGIDFDEEITSIAAGKRTQSGIDKGINLVNAAALINANPQKTAIWTVIAGDGKDSWNFQNMAQMIQLAGNNLDGACTFFSASFSLFSMLFFAHEPPLLSPSCSLSLSLCATSSLSLSLSPSVPLPLSLSPSVPLPLSLSLSLCATSSLSLSLCATSSLLLPLRRDQPHGLLGCNVEPSHPPRAVYPPTVSKHPELDPVDF